MSKSCDSRALTCSRVFVHDRVHYTYGLRYTSCGVAHDYGGQLSQNDHPFSLDDWVRRLNMRTILDTNNNCNSNSRLDYGG